MKKTTKKKPTNLEEAFAFYGFEYREGVHRIIDLAKKLGLEAKADETLEELLARV